MKISGGTSCQKRLFLKAFQIQVFWNNLTAAEQQAAWDRFDRQLKEVQALPAEERETWLQRVKAEDVKEMEEKSGN